jgi:hypothetical protein
MAVDFEKFVSWAESRLPPIEIKGEEVCINSIFTDDSKNKLWCNPFGGKNRNKYGVYHCWKTDSKGTLVGLVMKIDRCDRSTALKVLGLESEVYKSPELLDLDFGIEQSKSLNIDEALFKELPFPQGVSSLEIAPEYIYRRAQTYLDSRKITTKDFFVGVTGRYENRIIIPYYSPARKLIYYNGRSLGDHALRYLGPHKDVGAGKDDVLFFPTYPDRDSTVYLCEGEFDALTLNECGLFGVACGGKFISDKQAVILSQYKVVLALDADEAGQSAKIKIKNTLEKFGVMNIQHVVPPEKYKDWNKFYTELNQKIIKAYIDYNTLLFESENPYGI